MRVFLSLAALFVIFGALAGPGCASSPGLIAPERTSRAPIQSTPTIPVKTRKITIAVIQERTTTRRRHQAGPAERMDGRGAFQAMKLTHRQGLLAAPTLLLGAFVHGTPTKTSRPRSATAMP